MSESSSSEMSNKKRKSAEVHVVGTAGALTVILPDDVWPKVLDYLDHKSTLQCCAVCRTFLHSYVPQLPRVVLDRPRQLDAATIGRFKGVQAVMVLCFIRKSAEQEKVLVEETCWRLPTFLACLPKTTKNVYLSGHFIKPDGVGSYGCCTYWDICSHFDTKPTFKIRRDWEYFCLHPECYSTPQKYPLLGQLVMSICAAYRNGSIPQTMTIFGLFESDERLDDISAHYHLHNGNGAACQFCRNLCTSLPVSQVMQLRCALHPLEEFESEAVAHENSSAAHSICLTAPQLLEIISSRTGGRFEMEKFFDAYYPKGKPSTDLSSPFSSPFGHLRFTRNYFPCNEKGYPTTLFQSLSTSKTYANAFDTDFRTIAVIQALIRDHGFKMPKLSEEYAAGVYECAISEEHCARGASDDTWAQDEKKAFVTRSTFEALVEIGFPLKRTSFITFDDEDALHPLDDYIVGGELEDVFYAFELRQLRRLGR